MRDKNYLPQPQNITEAFKLAEAIASSQMVPKCYQNRPADVFVGAMWSHSLGIPVIQGLQGITVINGKATIWGDMALGLVRGSGELEHFKEEYINLSEQAKEELFAKNPDFNMIDKITARCTVKRVGQEEVVAEFSIREARQAGLFRKAGPWLSYPLRMLRMRARGFALRDSFTDILQGLGITEELADEQPIDNFATGNLPDGGRESVMGEVVTKKPTRKSKATAQVTPQPTPQALPDESEAVNPLAEMMAQAVTAPQVEEAVEAQPSGQLPEVREQTNELPPELVAEINEVEDQVGMIDDVESLVGYYRQLDPQVQIHVKEFFAKRRNAIETLKVK